MSNSLTGDYEAVLQIAIRQVNGVLGTLHQNGATPNAALQLLHSTTLQIADQPLPGTGEVFEDWVTKFQRAGPGRGLRDIKAQLTATAPPGAARMLTEAFENLYENWGNIHPPGTVGGLVKLQVSTITITVPDGSSSEITVNAGIRAAYYPGPGTTNLPAPIHGDVQAAFELSLSRFRLPRFRFRVRLSISPSSDDSKIQFIAAPGSGLSAGDASTIAGLVRKVIRENLTLLPVDLPPTFPFADFKGLGSGSNQVIALPFQLSGAGAPASGVQPLNQVFIGSSGFAVAVSKDYVISLIDIAAIRAGISQSVTFTLSGPWGIGSVSVTYQLSFTSGPTLTFQNGGIEISGQVSAQTSTWWAPNGYVSFTQLIT